MILLMERKQPLNKGLDIVGLDVDGNDIARGLDEQTTGDKSNHPRVTSVRVSSIVSQLSEYSKELELIEFD